MVFRRGTIIREPAVAVNAFVIPESQNLADFAGRVAPPGSCQTFPPAPLLLFLLKCEVHCVERCQTG